MADDGRLQVATATASFRVNSEDRLAVLEVQGGLVVLVADGAGGLPGAAAAADRLVNLVAAALRDPAFLLDAACSWLDLLQRADVEIRADRTAGETTAVVAYVTEHSVVGATVGDSGALVVADDGTVQDLALDQAKYRKRRLGSGSAVPTAFERVLPAGAVVVVATDGLFAYARQPLIAHAVLHAEDLEQAAGNLIDVARLPSGSLMDDVAVVLVCVG